MHNREAPAARNEARADEILSVSLLSPTLAILETREVFLPRLFTDVLVLTKFGDDWKIVSKAWDFAILDQKGVAKCLAKSASTAVRKLSMPIWPASGVPTPGVSAPRVRIRDRPTRRRLEGVYMWDLEAKHRLIDCGIGGGVHLLGHRHPAVVDALRPTSPLSFSNR